MGSRGEGATVTLNLAMAIAFFVPSLKMLIHHFHIPIIHFVYPPPPKKILQKNCFSLLGFTILPRELVNNTYRIYSNKRPTPPPPNQTQISTHPHPTHLSV